MGHALLGVRLVTGNTTHDVIAKQTSEITRMRRMR